LSETSPIVTVITPSYNQARFLEDTIQSVLRQEYPSLEYLIIDGGSTDGSVDIIRRYESQLAYWVSEPDSGQADAINKGLARASGKYVGWLNSDDVYLPGAIYRAVATFAEFPGTSMVYANGIKIDEEGNPIAWPRYGQYSLLDLLSMHIIHQPTVFMCRESVESVQRLDPTYHFLLDHHLWIRLARTGSLVFVDEFWAGARDHSQAKNTSQRQGFVIEAGRIIDEMSQFPDVADLMRQHPHQIEAGLRIFEAVYLLADNQAALALQGFLSAMRTDPRSARRCWRLMLLSLAIALNHRRAQTILCDLRARMQERHYIQTQSR